MGEAAYTKVTICGEEYRVAGEATGGSLRDLAAYVDHKMDEVRQRTSGIDMKRIAVLAALNLADELFRERTQSGDLRRQVRERAAGLGTCLEASLAQGSAAGGSADRSRT
jgi:cell division protein ZapA